MTSKNLFFKMLKDDLKQRLWVLILACVVFFIAMPVVCTFAIQNNLMAVRYSQEYNEISGMWEALSINSAREQAAAEFLSYFSGKNAVLILIAAVGAAITSISGFAYLLNRQTVDLMHSLPVRREKLFAVKFVSGIILYFVPYMIFMIIAMIVASFYGIVSLNVIKSGLLGALLTLSFYLSFYVAGILATMLTGKVLVSILGFIAICGYSLGVTGLVQLYVYNYLQSIRDMFDESKIVHILSYLSPVGVTLNTHTVIFNPVNFSSNSEYVHSIIRELLIWAVLVAAGIIFSLCLYKKRESEKAGTAMAFKVMEPILDMGLAIPFGLLFPTVLSLFGFSEMEEGVAIFWYVTITIIGVVLFHGILETIFSGDIKRCLNRWGFLIASVVVSSLFIVGFFYDVFNLEGSLPQEGNIESITVYSDNFDSYLSYYDESLACVNKEDFVSKHLTLEPDAEVMSLVNYLVAAYTDCRMDYNLGGYKYHYDDVLDKSYSIAVGKSGREYRGEGSNDFVLRIKLKNGETIVRSFWLVSDDELISKMKPIASRDEFVDALIPCRIYRNLGFEPVEAVVNMYEEEEGNFTNAQYWDYKITDVNGFIDVYMDELKKSPTAGLVNNGTVCYIYLSFSTEAYSKANPDKVNVYGRGKNTYYPMVDININVNSTMTKTLEFIKNNSEKLPYDYSPYYEDYCGTEDTVIY